MLISPSSVLPMSTAMAPASWHRLATCTNLPAHVRVLIAVHVHTRHGEERTRRRQGAGKRTATTLHKGHAST